MSSLASIENTIQKVSVIIPTINRVDSLCIAIKSVLLQTYPVHEILICDDGSSDGTKEIVCAFNDDKIKWIDCGKNGRPAIPRNIGISKSTGDWFAFLDDDDEWLPNKIFEQLIIAQSHNARALCTNAKIRRNGIIQNKEYSTLQKNIISFNDLIYSNYIMCSSALIHRSLLTEVIGFPEDENLKALEDYTLWIRVATQCDFYFLNSPLVIYNDAPAQSIRGKKNDTFLQRKLIFENLMQWSEKMKIKEEYVSIFKLEINKANYFINEFFLKKIIRKII